jgi:hypothetical protein
MRYAITNAWSKVLDGTTAVTMIQNVSSNSIMFVQSVIGVLPIGDTGAVLERNGTLILGASKYFYAKSLDAAGTLEVQ